jgi:long-chain acyl-CoA synthetase
LTILQCMLENAQNHPEKTAFIWDGGSITWEDFVDKASRFAGGLTAAGLIPGDTVLVCADKSFLLPFYYLSVWMAGGVAAPVNWKLSTPRLTQLGEFVSPKFVLFEDAYYDAALTCTTSLAHKPRMIGESMGVHWSELVSIGKKPDVLPSLENVVYLNFTSGSCGNPKGALTTLANLSANCESACSGLGLTDEDIHLSVFAPYVHPHELFARAVYLGGTAVLLANILPRGLAQAVEKHRVSAIMAIPPVYSQLMRFADKFDLSSLRLVEAGGMTTPPSLVGEFKRRVGVPVTTVWGSTETSGITLSNRGHEMELAGALGFALPGYQINLADESGAEIMDVEATGELVISGTGVVNGYWKADPDANSPFTAGHYYTGDIVRLEKSGALYYVGRWDGVLKVAGEKVMPAEIENLLLQLPEVEEAAMASLPDPVRGEIPVVYVVPAPGASLDVDSLRRHLASRLPAIKVPRQYQILSALPRTVSGKLDLRTLRNGVEDNPSAMLHGISERIGRLNVRVLDLLSELSDLLDEEKALRHVIGLGSVSRREELARLRELVGHNRGELHDEALERIFTYLWQTLRLEQG